MPSLFECKYIKSHLCLSLVQYWRWHLLLEWGDLLHHTPRIMASQNIKSTWMLSQGQWASLIHHGELQLQHTNWGQDPHPVHVIKNDHEDMIWGIDFIHTHKLLYCPQKKTFALECQTWQKYTKEPPLNCCQCPSPLLTSSLMRPDPQTTIKMSCQHCQPEPTLPYWIVSGNPQQPGASCHSSLELHPRQDKPAGEQLCQNCRKHWGYL